MLNTVPYILVEVGDKIFLKTVVMAGNDALTKEFLWFCEI